MSDEPKTLEHRILMESQRGSDGTFHYDQEYVTADLARELARELEQALAENTELKKEIQEYVSASASINQPKRIQDAWMKLVQRTQNKFQ